MDDVGTAARQLEEDTMWTWSFRHKSAWLQYTAFEEML